MGSGSSSVVDPPHEHDASTGERDNLSASPLNIVTQEAMSTAGSSFGSEGGAKHTSGGASSSGCRPGRMRIRIVSASNLPPVMNLFRWGTADPYAVLVLEDRTFRKQSPQHRTRRAHRTLNPRWREDFWFALFRGIKDLALHIEVWHQNDDTDDVFLGQVDIDLNPYLLEKTPPEADQLEIQQARKLQSSSFEIEQTLEPAENHEPEFSQLLSQPKQAATIKLEMAWEPALMEQTAVVGPRALLVRLFSAPQALRVMRVVLFGGAGALLLVSRSARWLCRGSSLADCQEMDVPGAPTCVGLAAIAVIVVTFIHFAGSSGFLGSSWTGEPVSLMDMLDTDMRSSYAYPDETEESTLRMQVLTEGLAKWNVNVGTAILPKLSFNVLRIIAMLSYLLSFVLCTLAALLAWVEHGPGTCLGEAFYIDLTSLWLLLLGCLTSFREKRMLLVADRDRWHTVEDPDERRRTGMDGMHISRTGGGSMNSPGLRFVQVARRSVTKLTQQAENLAQPLKDAWLPLQEQFHGGQERFRKSIDDLWGSSSLDQPLLRTTGLVSPSRRSGGDVIRGRLDMDPKPSFGNLCTRNRWRQLESWREPIESTDCGRVGVTESEDDHRDGPDLSSQAVCCSCGS